jgi:uncharacterized membrane protein
MVLMAVDHARYFIGRRFPAEIWGTPLFHYDDAVSFLTRWVTHICAPGFFFLMGTGMVYFHAARRRINWSEAKIFRHLVLRGLLLVALQLAVENPAWTLRGISTSASLPAAGGTFLIYAGVLYGLGTVMILCSALLRVKDAHLIAVSLLTILATQLFPLLFSSPNLLDSTILVLLFLPGRCGRLLAYYPPVAWAGLSILGMIFGRELLRDQGRTLKRALSASAICLVLFILVRTWGGFGNIHPPAALSWMGYLHVTKYPPSLAFILLTMGLNFLCIFALSRSERMLQNWGGFLLVFGRTALFFYLVHLYVYALLGAAIGINRSTSVVYASWVLGLLLLYPVCKGYARFKAHTAPDSIWRFF